MSTNDDTLTVEHEESAGRGRFFVAVDGKRLAEQGYRRTDERHVTLYHTEVLPELRGRGVARQLLDTFVAWARQSGTGITATCPYAAAQFRKDPSIGDVLDGYGNCTQGETSTTDNDCT